MPDPTTTYRIITATVPEWAEAATGDARDAEIARLRRTIAILEAMNDKFERTREIDLRVLNSRDDEITSLKAERAARDDEVADLNDSLYAREQAINQIDFHRDELARKLAERIKEVAKLQAELADVKAECCRLVCRNGDLEAEVARRDTKINLILNDYEALHATLAKPGKIVYERLVNSVGGVLNAFDGNGSKILAMGDLARAYAALTGKEAQ